MRKILTVSSILMFSNTSFAEQKFGAVDCSELSGSPYVCVLNHKDIGINKMHCPGWYENAQNIPGGVIDPGEITIIKFGSSKCDSKLVITFVDGHQQNIEGFDTSKNVVLHVK